MFTPVYLWNPFNLYFWLLVSFIPCLPSSSFLFPPLVFHFSFVDLSIPLSSSSLPLPLLAFNCYRNTIYRFSVVHCIIFLAFCFPPGCESSPTIPWPIPTLWALRAPLSSWASPHCADLHHCWLWHDPHLFLNLVPSARSSDQLLPCLWCVSASCN